jgi:hypothetical protein
MQSLGIASLLGHKSQPFGGQSCLPREACLPKKGFCFSPPVSFVVACVFTPGVRAILVSSSIKPVIKTVSERKVITFLVTALITFLVGIFMVMVFLAEIILSEGDTSAEP